MPLAAMYLGPCWPPAAGLVGYGGADRSEMTCLQAPGTLVNVSLPSDLPKRCNISLASSRPPHLLKPKEHDNGLPDSGLGDSHGPPSCLVQPRVSFPVAPRRCSRDLSASVRFSRHSRLKVDSGSYRKSLRPAGGRAVVNCWSPSIVQSWLQS